MVICRQELGQRGGRLLKAEAIDAVGQGTCK